VLVLFGVEQYEAGVGVLGDVHGDVGALQQLLRVVGVLGVDGHPDAGLHVQAQPLQQERLLEGGQELPSHGHRALPGGDAGEQDGELVAA